MDRAKSHGETSPNYQRRIRNGRLQKRIFTTPREPTTQRLANLNWAKGKPSDNDFATAEANLAAAQAAYQEAQWYLATLKGEPVPEDATGKQLAMLQQAKDNLTAALNQTGQFPTAGSILWNGRFHECGPGRIHPSGAGSR